MSDSLLIFTIGPVQGFVVEARRAHDLWAGSRILVELTRAAAQSVKTAAEKNGGELIYPREIGERERSLPNRLVARLGVNGQAAKQIARDAEKAVSEKWRELHESARHRLDGKVKGDPNWHRTWDEQVARHWEVYWSICDASGEANAQKYVKWYQDASKGLGARKQTRNFAPALELGAKDSLSGTRAALWVPKIASDDPNDSEARAYWKRVREAFATLTPGDERNFIPTILLPDGRERLDAIGATKRFTQALGEWRFPSVSSVAAAEFRKRANTPDAQVLLDQYAQWLAQQGVFSPGDAMRFEELAKWEFDGDLLYADSLTVEMMRDNYHLVDITEDSLAEGKRLLRQIQRAAGGAPNAYYAILAMDGDHMGKRVGACQSAAEHTRLSAALAVFAKQAVNIVEKQHAGRVVYAGGDDLLALVPLAESLDTARTVAQAFATLMPMPNQDPMTISAGIVFAHHQSPLDAALSAARRTEEIAKRVYGRNAVCVTALKRSGETVRVGAHWAFDGRNTLELIEEICKRFAAKEDDNERISSKFAYDALTQARALSGEPMRGAHAAALTRLVKRHSPRLQDPERFAKRLAQFAEDLDKDAPPDPKLHERQRGTVELAHWLLVARFLAQGGGE